MDLNFILYMAALLFAFIFVGVSVIILILLMAIYTTMTSILKKINAERDKRL